MLSPLGCARIRGDIMIWASRYSSMCGGYQCKYSHLLGVHGSINHIATIHILKISITLCTSHPAPSTPVPTLQTPSSPP